MDWFFGNIWGAERINKQIKQDIENIQNDQNNQEINQIVNISGGDYKEIVDNLAKELIDSKDQIASISEEKERLKVELSIASDENVELESKNNLLDDEREILESENSSLDDVKEALESKISEYENNNEALAEQISDYESLEAQYESLEEDYNNLLNQKESNQGESLPSSDASPENIVKAKDLPIVASQDCEFNEEFIDTYGVAYEEAYKLNAHYSGYIVFGLRGNYGTFCGQVAVGQTSANSAVVTIKVYLDDQLIDTITGITRETETIILGPYDVTGGRKIKIQGVAETSEYYSYGYLVEPYVY